MLSQPLAKQSQHKSLFRLFLSAKNEVKLYTRNQSLTLKEVVSFDSKAPLPSSLELFITALASSYLLTLQKEAKKAKLSLGEMEAQLTCTLQNPLELLGVIGYEEEAEISAITGKLYLYTESDPLKLQSLCQKALEKSLIYRLLDQNRVSVSIEPHILCL